MGQRPIERLASVHDLVVLAVPARRRPDQSVRHHNAHHVRVAQARRRRESDRQRRPVLQRDRQQGRGVFAQRDRLAQPDRHQGDHGVEARQADPAGAHRPRRARAAANRAQKGHPNEGDLERGRQLFVLPDYCSLLGSSVPVEERQLHSSRFVECVLE